MPADEFDSTKFVVGLGNPGKQYAGTRHNIGFEVVEALLRRWAAPPPRKVFGGLLSDVRIECGCEHRRVMLLMPQEYMNCSGRAVRAMADFYKAQPSDLLIVLDDMALAVGQLRARPGGSGGGHNGLSDIVAAMGTTGVARLRIGIGSPATPADWKDYVLHPFGPQDRAVIGPTIVRSAEAVEDWVFKGIQCVMDKYNARSDASSPGSE